MEKFSSPTAPIPSIPKPNPPKRAFSSSTPAATAQQQTPPRGDKGMFTRKPSPPPNLSDPGGFGGKVKSSSKAHNYP